MKIKNIVIYYPSFEKGGVEKIIINLIDYFSKKNINIYLITTKNDNLKLLKQKNINLIYSSKNYFNFLSSRFSTSLSCIFPLINLLKTLNNKNTIIHSMQSSYLPIIFSKFKKFKIVIRNSEDPIASIKYADNFLTSYIVFILRFFFYNFADKIITNSKGSAKSMKLFMFGKNKNKIQYIYNPYLTLDKIKASKKKKMKKNIILSVGRLCKQKNFEDLIIAFSNFNKKNNKYILKIIGQGSYKQKLSDLIRSKKMEKKIFLKGYLDNLDEEYKKSKLFILPSLYEGLGNVLIEALNFSLPCISTNCKSGPSEILCYGKGGYIVPVNNIRIMQKKMEVILNDYPTAIKKAEYGRSKLFRFNAAKQSFKYLKVLNSVL